MPIPILSARVTRRYVQHILASPETVFPMLCPEREKEWLPGWDARMIHSASGVAERGAVFQSPHALGAATWLVTEHDAPRRIAFVRWQPDGILVHIQISLGRQHHGGTAVCIEYVYTPTDESSRAILAGSTDQEWRDTMAHWEGSMNRWLQSQTAAR